MDSNKPQSNELILWLKALDLPIWAKVILVMIMAAILLGAGSMLIHGLYRGNKEEVSAATTLLAISLPIMLVVTALIFGSNGEKAFQKRTSRVLLELIPDSIKDSFGEKAASAKSALVSPPVVNIKVDVIPRGCIAHYCLTYPPDSITTTLNFSVALNVYKANVVFWLDNTTSTITDQSLELGQLADLIGPSRASCVFGALNEGYKLNPSPEIRMFGNQKMIGLVFIKSLPKDFLLQASETLYFAQDLAFFVRGFIAAESNIDVR